MDISRINVEPYKFYDGDREIVTKNPTQRMWEIITSSEEQTKIVEKVFDSFLKPEDEEYKNVDFIIKATVFFEYFDYHRGQLEATFPYTNTTK